MVTKFRPHALVALLVLVACDVPTNTDKSDDAIDETVEHEDVSYNDDVEDDDTDEADTSSATLEERLIFLREEEKLARDVYLTLYDTWEMQVFANIADSEEEHTAAVRSLLEQRDIADPVTDDTVGVFTDPVLADLYTELVGIGLQSRADALWVGCTVEDLDILDLETFDVEDDAEVDDLLGNLLCGSENHMRAFHNKLGQQGEEYEVQYITEARLEELLAEGQQSCME